MLGLGLLEQQRVVDGDGSLGRQGRQEPDLVGREVVRLEEVAHEHPVHLVPPEDGDGQVGAGSVRGDEAAGVDRVAEDVLQSIAGPQGLAVHERPARHALTRPQDQGAGQLGIEVESAAERQPPALGVVSVDPGGVAAEQLDDGRGDEVQPAVEGRSDPSWAVIV